MTYEAVEAGLKVELQETATLTDAQVVLHDWDVGSHGHAQFALIEYLALSRADYESYAPKVAMVWLIRVHLCVRFTEEAASLNAARDLRQEVIDRLLANPKLDASAFDTKIISGRIDPEERIEIGSLSFYHEWLDIEVEELVTV